MATRLKPTRINVENTPEVGDNAVYQDDNKFRWFGGSGDMFYKDFEWVTLTGNSLVIENISNNVTPSSNFTVSAGTVKPGIEYVLRINTGDTPYTMTLGTGVTNPNSYKTELKPNTINQFKFIATSTNQLELEGVDSAVLSEINWGEIEGTLSDQTDLQNALNLKADDDKVVHLAGSETITGTKTFQAEPVLPSKSSPAGDYPTKPATEAQVAQKLSELTILSYGNSTWNDFITAYQKNAIVYCRASSNSNPATGSQTRLAFMAYVNNADNPTEVEFQYYRSRSSHESDANQQDEVYVYKLTSSGTWTVAVRDTAAKIETGTGLTKAYTTSGTKSTLTIANDGVLTVNGNNGAVTVNDVKVSATAPSSPTEGMLWYDTTNDQLKVYDGSQWNVTGKEYNAGEGISIGDISINGRKGPSPDGFHVPSATEWQGVKTIMDGLSLTTGDDWRINLHMPFAGYRHYLDASPSSQGSNGYYWSSSPFSASSYNARNLTLDSSGVYANGGSRRAIGFSVRCFKDSYEVPNSSWTVVQGTLGSAGIFWNQFQGLISITNGSTGYTIMDKNLGATTVYNNGDNLTQANMGNKYQWGNNYGFPSTGTISNTSSTQVDASSYGPTNQYSSDTFIIGNNNWDSSNNDDLWGDTSGTITQENVISNTGVLSVNGETGDVTIQSGSEASGITTNQPSNPVAGSTYFDITNNVIKVYNGTDWDDIATAGVVSDTEYGSSWNGVTGIAPSKNAVYDKLNAMDTTIAGKQATISDLATIRSGASKGATAVQPGDNVSTLNNDAGYITSADIPTLDTAMSSTSTKGVQNKVIKSYVDTQISEATAGAVSNTAYDSSWDGVTGVAPSKNAVYDKISTMDTAISGNTTNINTINSKIPSEASATNQLADKDYVGDSINSVTAYYITKTATGGQFATYAELAAATTFYSGGKVRVPTKNDYTIVLSDENHDNATTRYIYNNGWEYQYTVNETALTQAQLNAINSGITAAKVATYDGYATGKQDTISDLATIRSGAAAGATAVQPGDNISDLNNDAGYITNADIPTDYVKTSGNQSISGTKTFTTSPVVPAKSTNASAANTTVIATEAQVAKKQDALSTQTAYTSQGTGQKVPQITTNNLGQVTNITEVNIDYPQIISDVAYGSSWNGDTQQAPSKNAVYDKISSMDTTIAGKQATLVSGTNIKTVNGNSLLGSGDITIDSGIAKIFTLSGTSDLTNAQAAYDWTKNGGISIIEYNSGFYYSSGSSNYPRFYRVSANPAVTGGTTYAYSVNIGVIGLNVTSDGAVNYIYIAEPVTTYTPVSRSVREIVVSNTTPSSGTASNIITIVTD